MSEGGSCFGRGEVLVCGQGVSYEGGVERSCMSVALFMSETLFNLDGREVLFRTPPTRVLGPFIVGW